MILKQTYSALLFPAISLMLLFLFAKPAVSASHSVVLNFILDTLPVSDSMLDGKIYESVEVEAYFAGGEASWLSYLQQNLNPSVPVDKEAKAGIYTVYIQFVVDIDGKISDVKPLTKHGYGMEAEVMRILRKSPLWIPAIQHGRKVRAYRKQPVTFQIEEEKKKKGRKG